MFFNLGWTLTLWTLRPFNAHPAWISMLSLTILAFGSP
jgi:hypothetical protein